MVTVLFIDDEADSVEPAQRHIEGNITDCHCEVVGFAGAAKSVAERLPDVVVLDILEGVDSGDPETPGLGVYDFIWDNHFCPIVVFSAHPELATDKHPPNPFITPVTKGAASSDELEAAIVGFLPHIQALQEARGELSLCFSAAVRDVAQLAFDASDDTTTRRDMIVRSGRRRVAGLMDSLTSQGQGPLACWEQYLIPPIDDDVRLADILHTRGSSNTDPVNFRLVLTPSCDMVQTQRRTPKVKEVLVARCKPSVELLKQMGLQVATAETLKKKLPERVLTAGYFQNLLPLPSMESCIPSMVADLRDIELVPLQSIGGKDSTYERTASIDSPFREMVSWAYLQIACRPGLPDRDMADWSEQISAARNPGGGGQP